MSMLIILQNYEIIFTSIFISIVTKKFSDKNIKLNL
jgi:hypothetical protein